MVTTTCNGITPLFYTLQRMERLLDQAMRQAKGEKVMVNGKEKVLSMAELQGWLQELQVISEYVI